MINHLSDSKDIVKLGGQVLTDIDTDKAMKVIPESVRPDFLNHLWSSAFWKRIEETHVPLDLIKERKGSYDYNMKTNVVLEYFPEEYTIQELNRLFPGWWMDEMDVKYEDKLRTIVVKGYLFVEIPTLQGKQTIKRWAMGATVVHVKKPKRTDDMTDEDYEYMLSLGPQPAQPDDRYKAARTEWIKLAGKIFGIGLEIYHQRITAEMRSHFEDIVRPLGKYGENYKKIAATFDTGHGFRNYLKELPTLEQIKRIVLSVDAIPVELKNSKQQNVRDLIMSNFILQKNDSNNNREKFEGFLKQMEATAMQYSNHQNQKKEN